MTKELYITLLDKGSNGNEILQILNSFVSDENEQPTDQVPTLEPIQF